MEEQQVLVSDNDSIDHYKERKEEDASLLGQCIALQLRELWEAKQLCRSDVAQCVGVDEAEIEAFEITGDADMHIVFSIIELLDVELTDILIKAQNRMCQIRLAEGKDPIVFFKEGKTKS